MKSDAKQKRIAVPAAGNAKKSASARQIEDASGKGKTVKSAQTSRPVRTSVPVKKASVSSTAIIRQPGSSSLLSGTREDMWIFRKSWTS